MSFPSEDVRVPKPRADLLEAEVFVKRVTRGERILVVDRQQEGDRPRVRAAGSPAQAIAWCEAALAAGAVEARWLWAERVNREPFTPGP